LTPVREMLLACSRTLGFASTMEDVPTVVDLKRTRGTFLDTTERCIIFGGRKEKKQDGERSSCRGKGNNSVNRRGCSNTSQKKTESKRESMVYKAAIC